MSNRFCVIMNEGNELLTLQTQPQDKVYHLKQGYLLVGDKTPYKALSMGEESWHIIGNIDNLPLLNYLLFDSYPYPNDFINKEIICLAVRRYGLKIIELLHGNFCIIYEDAGGNLTLVTEDETQRDQTDAANGACADRAGKIPSQPAALFTMPRSPCMSYAQSDEALNRDAPSCQYPTDTYQHRRKIAITRWHDNRLQFIQSWSYPHRARDDQSVGDEIKGKIVDIQK